MCCNTECCLRNIVLLVTLILCSANTNVDTTQCAGFHDVDVALGSSGETRRFKLYIPPVTTTKSDGTIPILLSLHGITTNPVFHVRFRVYASNSYAQSTATLVVSLVRSRAHTCFFVISGDEGRTNRISIAFGQPGVDWRVSIRNRGGANRNMLWRSGNVY